MASEGGPSSAALAIREGKGLLQPKATVLVFSGARYQLPRPARYSGAFVPLDGLKTSPSKHRVTDRNEIELPANTATLMARNTPARAQFDRDGLTLHPPKRRVLAPPTGYILATHATRRAFGGYRVFTLSRSHAERRTPVNRISPFCIPVRFAL
jgi:hypothetical protein